MIPRSSIAAVIFDFDGVLANTEPLHYRTFAAVLEEEGIVLEPSQDSAHFLGRSDVDCFQLAFDEAGRELTPARCRELVDRKKARFYRGSHEVELFPGATRLIDEVASRGPFTIASSGTREDIESVLGHHGLLERFPRFVSADDVRHSKPEPDCFLRALELLGRQTPLDAGQCVVFEDSLHGVDAARRAGMRCVAITNTFSRDALCDADEIVDSLEEWSFD